VLGRGRSGTVYLARHIELDEYRAIKEVPRSAADYRQFCREALILKSIRHPGIPIVYDLEETADHFYMIEEWMDGDSLYSIVSDLGHLSTAAVISYGIQICHLVYFLHSAKPDPILYLDLHPKNLMICGDTVKLVDFDHSVHSDEAESMTKRYGAVGFAAPEQYTDATLDERTDIYAIGAVLYYMLTGAFPDRRPMYPGLQNGRGMMSIIRRCLRRDPSRRYQSAAELCDALEHQKQYRKRYRKSGIEKQEESSLLIAVAGAASGAGTTHMALGLTVWLRRCGLAAVYEEKNNSGAVRQFAEYMKADADAAGVFHICGISMIPEYGPAVKLKQTEYQVRICDCGTIGETFLNQDADGYLLVCGSRPWEWRQSQDAMRIAGVKKELCVVFNHYSGTWKNCLPATEKGTACFLMPCVSDPWAAGIPADLVYEALWRRWTAEERKGFWKRWLGKIRRWKERSGGS
jgi:serine/threonine-protein kinase